jgi:gamma-glutamylcyclotransferase (GGCT)/AIG2-like uncharacterized protein YtfP
VLFVYGTLQFPPVLGAVIGRVPAMVPATLSGWRAAALPGRVYPGLVPAAGGRAVGQVLSALTAGDWARLDHFEGDAYDRRELPLDGGGRAWAYVWQDAAGAAAHDWDPARFAAIHLGDYVIGCAEWRDDVS